jgi:hypothetical protein
MLLSKISMINISMKKVNINISIYIAFKNIAPVFSDIIGNMLKKS